jgi:hypothetical protein
MARRQAECWRERDITFNGSARLGAGARSVMRRQWSCDPGGRPARLGLPGHSGNGAAMTADQPAVAPRVGDA